MNIAKPVTSLTSFLLAQINAQKRLFFLMALAGLFWAFINTFMPYVLKLIIDHVVSFTDDKTNLMSTVQPYVIGYIGLWIALSVTLRFHDCVRLRLFPNLRESIMQRMFGYLGQHSHHYFQNNLSGSLINKINDMQSGVTDIFSTLDDLFSQLLGMGVAVVMLLFVHPVFAVILVGWAIVFLMITFLYLKPIERLSTTFAESKSTVVGKMVDSVTNIINVRLFAQQGEEEQYVGRSIKEAVRNDRAMQLKIIKMRIWWDVTLVILMSLNLYVLVSMYSKNQVTIGDFTFVISLSISVLWNLWFLATQLVSFSEQIGRCKQALSIITQPHDIVDASNAKSLVVAKGEIKFHEVNFHYDEGARLFHNKNIEIKPGQKVGLVGFSGSGKSTFVNLILRLFEVESGVITIDGQDINLVTQQSLREQIALIPQDITLFHRTLMENIRFGNMQATDEQVIAIAEKAHCHEFISQLPQGYQSMVGERGIKLSGGQRQRIAIARAMLKNSPILILDEATSSLDSVTENYIQEALHLLMENKTTIVIAHRLSTLSKMDRILVFANGAIIEDGTHDELLAMQGHYAKLWQMQAGGFLPE